MKASHRGFDFKTNSSDSFPIKNNRARALELQGKQEYIYSVVCRMFYIRTTRKRCWSQEPPKRDEAALKEEEELQLALALSLDEQENKNRIRREQIEDSVYGSLNKPGPVQSASPTKTPAADFVVRFKTECFGSWGVDISRRRCLPDFYRVFCSAEKCYA